MSYPCPVGAKRGREPAERESHGAGRQPCTIGLRRRFALVSPETQNFRSGLLSLQVESTATSSTLRVRGELDLATADIVREALREALANGHAEVIVDLSELVFIDSTGIAILIAAISAGDGVLRFVPSMAPGVSRVLRLTGVEARMTVADPS